MERVTYRKITHTYANVLRLMDQYLDFTFTMSQPPLFHYIQQHHPGMVQQMKRYLTEQQRWECTGAMEVEADTQLPVGEGLVRSILYGQERMKAVRPNGTASQVVWIPDVFGYTACLPRLLQLADIPYFFTTKILRSTITQFPHNSFLCKSPDGSRVLTHLGVTGYNGKVTLDGATEATRNYQQGDVHSKLLIPCGYGDGGGGPTEDQLERCARLQKHLTNTPKSRWSTIKSFFDRLYLVKEKLPVYWGKLFLE